LEQAAISACLHNRGFSTSRYLSFSGNRR